MVRALEVHGHDAVPLVEEDSKSESAPETQSSTDPGQSRLRLGISMMVVGALCLGMVFYGSSNVSKDLQNAQVGDATIEADAVVVTIGSSTSNEKCVTHTEPVTCSADAGNKGVRHGGGAWNDQFTIRTDGNQVCAKRLDYSGGWAMGLSIWCNQADAPHDGTCGEVKHPNSPYGSCKAWGDPHYTSRFAGEHLNFYGLGLYKLAVSTDGCFEVHAWQCKIGGASTFAAFAIDTGNGTIQVVDTKVYIDGKEVSEAEYPDHMAMRGSPAGKNFEYSACGCGNTTGTIGYFHALHNPGGSYGISGYLDMTLEMNNEVMGMEGICVADPASAALNCGDSLFTTEQIKALTDACGHGCPPAPTGDPPTPEEICEAEGREYSKAQDICKDALEEFKADCIMDYCASGVVPVVPDTPAPPVDPVPTPPPTEPATPMPTKKGTVIIDGYDLMMVETEQKGYCLTGYYGGNCKQGHAGTMSGATEEEDLAACKSLEACSEQCFKEEKCEFIAWKKNVCSRYGEEADGCEKRKPGAHIIHQKVPLGEASTLGDGTYTPHR